jgi:predicted component of type VI protein secretion system
MHVRVKILQGSNAGKEVKLPVPKCLIGRGDECHLRPQSDAVSRRHCEIVTNDKEVAVRDLGSRNGTYVNGEQIKGETLLLTGDVLRIGPLEFEMLIEHTAGKLKRPKVADIKEAVTRTAEVASNSTQDLSDVTSWLEEGDRVDKQRKHDPDTRQYRVDDTVPPAAAKTDAATTDTKTMPAELKRPEKKPPGKLPPRQVTQTKDSREAAADMLKKLFNRR